jgi:hypothetical protein
MSVQISYKKQISFFILFFLVLLASIEITFRVYDFYNPNCRFLDSEVFSHMDFDEKRIICQENNKLIWENNENISITPNQHFKTININSDGFRGMELQEDPDYRIFVVGGSTTFGNGATSNDVTIPDLLQKITLDKFPNKTIEVINAGIPAAYSYTETNLIKNKFLSYNPNLLIIYDGWNDLEINYDVYSNPSLYQLDKIVRFIKQIEYVTPQVLVKLYSNYAYESAEKQIWDKSNIEEKADLWQNSWMSICKLQDEYDFKTVVILQPLVGTGSKQLTLEEEKYFKYYDGDNKIKYYQFYADALMKLESECTTTYDLRNAFDSNSETVFFDFGHMGKNGNKIIAKKFLDIITPILIEDLK